MPKSRQSFPITAKPMVYSAQPGMTSLPGQSIIETTVTATSMTRYCDIISNAIAPDYIVLAGFMRVLSQGFIQAFEHRILNIHPSLLPAYKGLNTHQRVLDNNEKQHGVSIHLVTGELDAGPIILQASYAVEAKDSVENLQSKGHQLEHQMYPQLLSWLSAKKLTIEGGRVYYDQTLLEHPISFNS